MASTCRHCLLLLHQLDRQLVMWRSREGSGTTYDSWETFGRRHRSHFGSVRNRVSVDAARCRVPLLSLLLVGARPTVLHPRLHQGLHALISLSTSTPPDPSIIASSNNIQTGNIEDAPPETVHAWLQAARNGNIEALAALFQLHSIVSSTVRASFQIGSSMC